MSNCSGWRRAFLVLFVLVAFVGLQSAAAIAEHPHSHGKDHTHCCAVCHATHLGVLQASAGFGPCAPVMVETSLSPAEYRVSTDYLGVPSPSRAAPA